MVSVSFLIIRRASTRIPGCLGAVESIHGTGDAALVQPGLEAGNPNLQGSIFIMRLSDRALEIAGDCRGSGDIRKRALSKVVIHNACFVIRDAGSHYIVFNDRHTKIFWS